MKAVIAVPPVEDLYFTPRRASALGAVSLKRELEDTGIQSRIFNFSSSGLSKVIDLPEELSYLGEFFIQGESGPLSWFRNYRIYGTDYSKAAETIISEKPDILFISSFAWAYAESSLKLAEAVHSLSPETRIVTGGHGPTSLPDYFIKKPVFTLTSAGEIEGNAALLLEKLKLKEIFVDFRKFDKIAAPPPVSSIIEMSRKTKLISVILSRGCPLKCSFCSNYITHGRRFRTAGTTEWENEIFAELKNIHPESKIRINIEDDNILFRKNDFFSFLSSIRDFRPEVSFTAENGMDYNLLEKEDIDFLKDTGFEYINLSLGILSEYGRKKENRNGDPYKLSELVKYAHKIKLPVTVHFIAGLKEDSPDDIIRTLKFLDELPSQTGISPFYPVPGLPGFSDSELFLSSFPGLAAGSSLYPWNNTLSTKQLITFFRTARWSNFKKKIESGNKLKYRPEEIELYNKIKKTGILHTIVKRKKSKMIIPVKNIEHELFREFVIAAG